MKHLAVVLDGNRRYARKHNKPDQWGHAKGVLKVEELLEWAISKKIPILTIYSLSLKNLERTGLDYIFGLLNQELIKAMDDERIHKNQVRIRAIGRVELLPKKTQQIIKQVEERTKDYSRFQFNLAIAYDGRAEIVDSVKRIAEQVKQGKLNPASINERMVENNLYSPTSPDLIIRTGGENRLSGFLLWGSSYAELYFSNKMWPEFSKRDFDKALDNYNKRERRFGL